MTHRGFTLIELLVVVAVIFLLFALLTPLGLRVLERAKVARVMNDLRSIETAIETYRIDHETYPPVTLSCQSSDAAEELQLPLELSEGGYLPRNPGEKTSSILYDPFSPASTYKYVATQTYWLNGQHMPDFYAVWVPSDFPVCHSSSGQWQSGPEAAIDWAIWSVGPRNEQMPARLRDHLPLAADAWYHPTDVSPVGILARIKPRADAAFFTSATPP